MRKDVKEMQQQATEQLGLELYHTFRKKKRLFGEKVNSRGKGIKIATQIVLSDPLLDKLDEKSTSRFRRDNMMKEKQKINSDFPRQRHSRPAAQFNPHEIAAFAMDELELADLDPLESAC
ncbi:MAG: hypothetical protein ACM3UU_10355 [Ignavibacteriales bacterium]